MDEEQRQPYDRLGTRFADLDELWLDAFVEHEMSALRNQRSHRRFQLALALGVALTGILGALQAAVDAAWVGAALAILGLGSAAIAHQQRERGPLARHLTDRAKAEKLRSLYFRYLSGTGPVDRRGLEAAVVSICHPLPVEEPKP